jgi:hypothetical protein
VPAGTVLRSVSSITITTPGAVIDSLDIAACVDIQASNVTIKRSRIHSGNCGLGTTVVRMEDNVSGVLIEDTEIDGLNADASNYGIMGGGGYTCLRCNIHGVGNGFNVWGSHPVTIQDSYIHDLYIRDDLGTHNEDMYIGGFAAGLTVRHNTLENWDSQTGTITLFGDFSPVQNVTIDSNLLNGGGYALYGGSGDGKPYSAQTKNIVVTNNHFGRKFYAQCGYWGPVAYYSTSAPGNRWSGNVWDGTTTPVNP